jgi:hypothetical protein
MDDHRVTRRDVVKGGAAAMTLAAAGPTAAGPAFAYDNESTVTGVVFEDRSRSGTRQPDDPGIPGVLVSNGRDVVRTDRDGRYALPMDDESIRDRIWLDAADQGPRRGRGGRSHNQ